MPFDDQGVWRPNIKQEKILVLPDSIKEAFYGGGAGSGKTELLLMLPIARQFYKFPSFKQLFLRRTFPEIENEVEPRSKLIYPKFGGVYHQQKKLWTFESGATIRFGHCEHDDDVHQYDSMEINLFTPDELTSLTEYIFLYIALTRVRTSDKNLPAITRASGMPGGVGHTWVKNRFVDPDRRGGKIIIGKGGRKRIFIFATQADNKEHIDPDYKNSLEALPEAEKNAKLHGSFDAYLGQVFNEFRENHIPSEPDNALHCIDAFDIPEWWPRIVVGDWGFEHYTWIGYGAISPDKRLYVYREQVWKRTKIEQWAPFVREHIEKEHPRVVKFCRSARQNRGQEHTIEQQINEALGVQIELSSNNKGSRVAGKQLLHEYLRFEPKRAQLNLEEKEYDDTFANWLLRNRDQAEYESYIKSFQPADEEVLPKLQIFKNECPFLINAIKACIHDKNDVEDVEEFDGDDAYDGIRYMVDTADRFFDEARDEYSVIKQRDKLKQQYETTQDMHMMYMYARQIEAIKSGPQPIRRFHR
jgi:hypothetical protein